MADLKQFAEQLVNLTVKEVNELATILKDEYGIEPAAAAVVVAAGGGEGAAEEAQTEFTVVLKGAYIHEAVFIGDNQLDALVALKSKEEVIGEIIGLLQSPAKNVVSALKSGGGKIAGIVKTLSER